MTAPARLAAWVAAAFGVSRLAATRARPYWLGTTLSVAALLVVARVTRRGDR